MTAECGCLGLGSGAEVVAVENSDPVITPTARRLRNFGLLGDDAGAARSIKVKDVKFDELINDSRLAGIPVAYAVFPVLRHRKRARPIVISRNLSETVLLCKDMVQPDQARLAQSAEPKGFAKGVAMSAYNVQLARKAIKGR